MEIINKNRLLANTIDHIYRYTILQIYFSDIPCKRDGNIIYGNHTCVWFSGWHYRV